MLRFRELYGQFHCQLRYIGSCSSVPVTSSAFLYATKLSGLYVRSRKVYNKFHVAILLLEIMLKTNKQCNGIDAGIAHIVNLSLVL